MEAIGRIAFDATTDFQEERVAVGSSGVRFGVRSNRRTHYPCPVSIRDLINHIQKQIMTCC